MHFTGIKLRIAGTVVWISPTAWRLVERCGLWTIARTTRSPGVFWSIHIFSFPLVKTLPGFRNLRYTSLQSRNPAKERRTRAENSALPVNPDLESIAGPFRYGGFRAMASRRSWIMQNYA